MKQYMTVKEVCRLTGLTRKHLYYFHHENVVRAVGYANYSVEGNDGYKLYDQPAVEKLQLIALYYHLGFTRSQIRDMMLDPKYDSYTVLNSLIIKEQQRILQIEQTLAILNQLVSGITNCSLSPATVQSALQYFTKEKS